MNPPLISALLPSRGRPDSLRRSVASLREYAHDPATVEVLVAADPDDPLTFQAALDAGCTLLVAPQRYGYARLNEYFNLLAAAGTGEWLLLWNDDATMTTPGWDRILADLPAAVLVADLQTAHSPHLCTFPAVRARAVAAVGVFSAHTCHCDTYWQDIGRATGTIAPVPVHVHHDRADLTGGHNDQTRAEALAGYRSADYYSDPVQTAIHRDIEKVRTILHG